jgi:hypothetical protein
MAFGKKQKFGGAARREQNPNQMGNGTLWINNKKEKAAQPDFTGIFFAEQDIPAGTKLRIAGWEKEDKNGADILSLAITIPQESNGGGGSQQKASGFGQKAAFGGKKKSAPVDDDDEEEDDDAEDVEDDEEEEEEEEPTPPKRKKAAPEPVAKKASKKR